MLYIGFLSYVYRNHKRNFCFFLARFVDLCNIDGMIHYSAVVLTQMSQAALLAIVGQPEGWKAFAHHMTIIYGQGLPASLKGDAGKEIKLVATHVGRSDKAVAVKVAGYYSNNEIPHVTVAVNITEGGKPVDSNKIGDWQSIEPIDLYGMVMEVEK